MNTTQDRQKRYDDKREQTKKYDDKREHDQQFFVNDMIVVKNSLLWNAV